MGFKSDINKKGREYAEEMQPGNYIKQGNSIYDFVQGGGGAMDLILKLAEKLLKDNEDLSASELINELKIYNKKV